MTDFAAFGRVERGRVVVPPPPVAAAFAPFREGQVNEVDDAPGSSPETRLASLIAATREQWAMATFFLFDANSWR